jgi:hypothetical protein
MRDATFRHFYACDVNNDGIVRWSAFDLENAPDRPLVQRAGSQPIHRLCRKRDQLPGAQEFPCTLHRSLKQAGCMRPQNFGNDRWRLIHRGNLPVNPGEAHEKSHSVATLLLGAAGFSRGAKAEAFR